MRADIRSFFPTREQVEDARAVLVFAHSEMVNGTQKSRTMLDIKLVEAEEVTVIPEMVGTHHDVGGVAHIHDLIQMVDDYVETVTAEFEAVDVMLLRAIDRHERR